MDDPKCSEEYSQGGSHGQPGSSAVDKAVVKEALSKIPGLKNLFRSSHGTTEAAAQQASKDADKQSIAKSKL